jgi:uncharacterized protein with NRDE domain
MTATLTWSSFYALIEMRYLTGERPCSHSLHCISKLSYHVFCTAGKSSHGVGRSASMLNTPLSFYPSFFFRETLAAHVWDEPFGVVGGRDLVSGGTWLCIRPETGRIACVTNFREVVHPPGHTKQSRGALPVDFVCGSLLPSEFLHQVSASGLAEDKYPGFSLLAVDLQQREAGYLCNRGGKGCKSTTDRVQDPHSVEPGVHGIANNNALEAPWPKVSRGVAGLQSALDDAADGGVPWERLFGVLSDDSFAEGAVPITGYGEEFERAASGIFVPVGKNDNG